MLCYLPREDQRQQLEEFRVHYEMTHGPVDVTKRYTSTWPTPLQQWLFEHQPQQWFDGLPPFVQAFLKTKISELVGAGQLTLSDERSMRSHRIRTGPDEAEHIDRFWLSQYLGGPIRAPEDAGRSR